MLASRTRSLGLRRIVASIIGTLALTVPTAAAPPAAVSAAGAGAASQFRAVGPFRLADTRAAACTCTRIDEHTTRVVVAGRNGVGNGITAVALTVTATAAPLAGYVSVYPAGRAAPDTSTLNLRVGADVSNSTIIPVGNGGAVDVYTSVTTQIIVDISGSFTPAETATAGRFVPTVPTRVLDTRVAQSTGMTNGTGGSGATVTIALPSGVSPDARAVAVNVTSVDALGPGYLAGYAAGSPAPDTSFLNPDGSGAALAASVILPVSAQGLTITSLAGGQLVVDLVGWFTGDSAPSSSNGLLVPVEPVRLLDTRASSPPLWPMGTREVALPVPGAAALVTNVTVVDAVGSGFVTAYPAGTPLPATSSLNAAGPGSTMANLAITATSTRGTAYFSSRGTDVIVDLTGYFTGSAVVATAPVPANVAPVPRVLMIGDSTLGGFIDVPAAQASFRGFRPILDAKPCRRLIHPSCTSRFTHIAPNTAIDAIGSAQAPVDIVVIKAGYNDGSTDFDSAIAQVVAAARAKGASEIIWLTYSESTTPGSYNNANAALKRLAGSAAYPDLVVADWRAYAAASSGWYGPDRVHLMAAGVWATGDYISRWVAHVSRIPCAMPWTVGTAISDPCPSPDAYAAAVGGTPDLRGLYRF